MRTVLAAIALALAGTCAAQPALAVETYYSTSTTATLISGPVYWVRVLSFSPSYANWKFNGGQSYEAVSTLQGRVAPPGGWSQVELSGNLVIEASDNADEPFPGSVQMQFGQDNTVGPVTLNANCSGGPSGLTGLCPPGSSLVVPLSGARSAIFQLSPLSAFVTATVTVLYSGDGLTYSTGLFRTNVSSFGSQLLSNPFQGAAAIYHLELSNLTPGSLSSAASQMIVATPPTGGVRFVMLAMTGFKTGQSLQATGAAVLNDGNPLVYAVEQFGPNFKDARAEPPAGVVVGSDPRARSFPIRNEYTGGTALEAPPNHDPVPIIVAPQFAPGRNPFLPVCNPVVTTRCQL